MPTHTVQLDDPAQVEAAVSAAAKAFATGGVVIFPTETVYGVGAAATDPAAVTALRTVKQRADTQPFTVHLPGAEAATRYVDDGDPYLMRFLRKVMPGPVTVIAEVDADVVKRKAAENGFDDAAVAQLYHENTIGLRCPDHDLGRRILGATDAPVVASSANRRGDPPPRDAEEAAAALGDDVDLVVDGGHCRYAKASTIVRVTGSGRDMQVEVLRDGVYDERFIRKLLGFTMLLVCTGNTCRSPMAQAIATDLLAGRDNVAVISAGVFASDGAPATGEAVDAVAKLGLDLSRHRSTALTAELINQADVIYTMTDSHRRAILDQWPSAADKTHRLDPDRDIADPIGGSPEVYRQCADMIRKPLQQRIKEQQP